MTVSKPSPSAALARRIVSGVAVQPTPAIIGILPPTAFFTV